MWKLTLQGVHRPEFTRVILIRAIYAYIPAHVSTYMKIPWWEAINLFRRLCCIYCHTFAKHYSYVNHTQGFHQVDLQLKLIVNNLQCVLILYYLAEHVSKNLVGKLLWRDIKITFAWYSILQTYLFKKKSLLEIFKKIFPKEQVNWNCVMYRTLKYMQNR